MTDFWTPLRSVMEVIDVFEELGVAYHVGGSFAGSLHGVPRQTNDLDLVADLSPALASILELRLKDRFYVDASMIRRALRNRKSFNLVHLATGFKIDVFVLGESPFDRMELSRSTGYRVEELSRTLMIKSAEDTVLRKLQWYRLGGEVSDRQWNDLLGIVRAQGDLLDRSYLESWAGQPGVVDLLEGFSSRKLQGGSAHDS